MTRDTHRIDFDQVAALAREHKPKLIVAGASAYPREIPHGKFAEIAQRVGAKLFVDMAHYAGLVAAGLHDNPVPVADFVTTTTHKTLRGPRGGMSMCRERIRQGPRPQRVSRHSGRAADARRSPARRFAFGEALRPEFKHYAQAIIDNAKALAEALLSGGVRLVSGGTDNHLMLVDVTPLGLGGKQAEEALGRCGITVNKNMIPYDERKPMDPSGIRIGTPALTTRGMGTAEMKTIAGWIIKASKSRRCGGARPNPHRRVRPVRAIRRAGRSAGRRGLSCAGGYSLPCRNSVPGSMLRDITLWHCCGGHKRTEAGDHKSPHATAVGVVHFNPTSVYKLLLKIRLACH